MTTIAVRPSGGPSQRIAAEIRAELGRQQLSNRRLAMMIGGGVSYAWVNRRISSCDVDLTFEDVEKIAKALDVPVQRLVSAWLPPMDSNHQPAGYPRRPAPVLALTA